MRCAHLGLVALQEKSCLYCFTDLVSDRDTPQSRYETYNYGIELMLLSSFPATCNQSLSSAMSVLSFFDPSLFL